MRLAVIMVIALCIFTSFSYAQECDYSIEISINGTEFTKESFKWRMKAVKLEGASTNITGAARIEDLSGNIIKSYKPWTNLPISKQKTSNEYSPNLKEGSYKIISEITVGCDDISKGNNIDAREIKIKSGNMEVEEANVQMQQLILENSEKQNTLPQAQENKNTIQQIQENESGNNPAINESQNNETQNQVNTKEYENIVNLKDETEQESSIAAEPVKNPAKGKYSYISSNEKAKNLIIYSLLAVSIILNIMLIWRR